MAKSTKIGGSKVKAPTAETPMDKTTRIVRKMVEEQDEQRRAKNDCLRTARLERDANTPAKPSR